MANRQRTALVTGCSEGGLGFALCRAFAREGYRVFCTARDPDKAAALTAGEPLCEVVALDVSSGPSIAACMGEVARMIGGAGGGLDVLVNNAGAMLTAPLLDTSFDEARRLFDVNVWGLLAVTQAAAPLLIEAGGTIMNIASVAGAVCMAWQGVYNSSKAAAVFLSETLRMELRPLGVRVVTAMVGEVDTQFYNRKNSFSLKPESRYKSIEGIIWKQSTGALQVNNETADVVAGKLVGDVVGGRRGKVWRGGVAGTARYASWLLPTSIFEWLLHRGRGLTELSC
ncbi:hypothetical protein GGR56DRAFT_662043 [Xylariaceae sp. FL0804]|nr:hypothetical protein GGR56DRAFT_662043 [Xylariaceae sp. FL0804]